MQIKRITAKGLIPFPQQFEVLFPGTPGLVNLRGPNGGGKSSFLDLVPLALFKEAPNRTGGIYGQFPADCRDGLIEVEWEMNGNVYVARRMVDAHTRKNKAFFFCNGAPLSEGKENEFNAALAEHFCSLDMYLCSVYTTQNNRGNLLAVPEAKQRELFAEMLGLGGLAELHEKAKEKTRETETTLRTTEARVNQLQGLLVDEADLQVQIEALNQKIADATLAKEEASRQIEAKRQELANARANTQNLDGMNEEITRLSQEIADLDAKIKDAQERATNNRAMILDKADAIKAAVQKTSEFETLLPTKRAEAEQLQKQIVERSQSAAAEYQKSVQAHGDQVAAKREDLNKVKANFEELRSKELILISQINIKERDLNTARGASQLKDIVPCTSMDIAPQCQLLKSAFDASLQIEELEKQLQLLQEEHGATMWERQILETGPIVTIEAELTALEAAKLPLPSLVGTGDQALLDATQAEIKILEGKLVELQPLVKLAPNLQGVEQRIADLEANITEWTTQRNIRARRVEELQAKVQDARQLAETVKRIEREVADIETIVKARELDIFNWTRDTTRLQAQLDNNKKILGEIQGLQQEIKAIASRLDGWYLYKEAVSPKGIQALETDAAGPEISAICNDILAKTYGPRFTIKVETLRELITKTNKDGEPETRERFQIRVIDNEKAIEGVVDDKSGGEKAILGEIISLAIAIYNKRKQKHEIQTLIRDEVTAPLTKDNGEKYLQMLRVVQQIGPFSQIIYVSHNTDLQDQADHTLVADGGKVTVL